MKAETYDIEGKELVIHYNEDDNAVMTRDFVEKILIPTFKMLERINDKIGSDITIEEACEKLIPKSPYMWGDGYADGELVMEEWECPSCGAVYEMEENHSCCPNCGQKISWDQEKSLND